MMVNAHQSTHNFSTVRKIRHVFYITDKRAGLGPSLFINLTNFGRIRGSLGSLMMMSANFGILLAFLAGDYLPFAWVPRLFICLPIIFLLSVLYFPETPFYFMRTNRELKAIASLEFYRNIRSHDDRSLVDFDGEMEKLKTVDLNGDTEIQVPLCVHDFSEYILLHVNAMQINHLMYSIVQPIVRLAKPFSSASF